MKNANLEFILFTTWYDCDGRAVQTDLLKFDSKEEAEKRAAELKKGNGGYVTLKIEEREAGTMDKIDRLEKEIKRMKEELERLYKG